MTERVLVTGADGFVGPYVCRRLIESGYITHAGVRGIALWPELQQAVPGLTEYSLLGDLSANDNLHAHLANVSTLVHLAGRAPAAGGVGAESLQEYRHVNVDGTKSIALAAADAGVRRLIFVSTVKVHGESTKDLAFSPNSPADPRSPYAVSKWEAEEALRDVAAKTRLEVTVVRPPQVYGPGVRGNFLRLMQVVDRAMPLPLPKKPNRRSMICANNLADFLVCCVARPEAAGRSFLVKDADDISTRELITRLAQLLSRPLRLLTVSEHIIRFAAKLTSNEKEAGRVLDSLVVDSRRTEEELDWIPPVKLDDGLEETTRWYQEMKYRSGVKTW